MNVRKKRRKRDSSSSFQRAVSLHQRGDLDNAERAYRAILAKDPKNADAWHLLGGIHLHRGQSTQAISMIEKAISLSNRVPLFHTNLGVARMHIDDLDGAIDALQQATRLQPDLVEALGHLATAYTRKGEYQRALPLFQKAIERHPDAQLWNNMGQLYVMLNQLEKAQHCFNQSLLLNPNYGPALNNAATLLMKSNEMEDAERLLRNADRSGGSPHIWNNLGQCLQAQGKHEQAVNQYQRALASEEQTLWRYRCHAASPVVFQSAVDIEQWRLQFSKGLAQLPQVYLTDVINDLSRSHAQPPYRLAYQGCDNADIKTRYANKFIGPEPIDLEPNDKPLIALCVTSGHEGIFLACCSGLIAEWDFERADLAIVCNRSSLPVFRAALKVPQLQYHVLDGPFSQMISALHEVRFDLIYYWEVGSDAVNYFLPFFRPGRVQCTSWGSAESSGITHVDYYIDSRPWQPCDDVHSETEIRMERIPITYRPPVVDARFDFSVFGPRAYVCAQNLFKLHPDFDRLVAGILERDPGGVFYLFEGKFSQWTRLIRRRLRRNLGDLDRIRFLPRMAYEDYLGVVASADVMLDSIYFSGGNTSYEALSLGTPVITLPGRWMRGRFTYGCYQTMGFLDCVAHNEDEFVALAVDVAHKGPVRDRVRGGIRDTRHALINDREAASEFQNVLIDLSQRTR